MAPSWSRMRSRKASHTPSADMAPLATASRIPVAVARVSKHATLVFPDDLEPGRGQALLALHLDREARRHALLAACYGVLALLSIPIALVPGPNVFGYVFAFLLVGHFLYRGARLGRTRVTWMTRSSATLVELRRLPSIAPDERERFIHEISGRLGLAHLVAFFERVALGGA